MAFDSKYRTQLHILGEVREVAHGVDEILNVVLGLAEDFAAVHGLQVRNQRLPVLHLVGQAVQVNAPLVNRKTGPFGILESLSRQFHRPINVFGL